MCTGGYQVKCPTKIILFLLCTLIWWILLWRLTACYQSYCLKIKGNNFPAESGHWWIANDEMTRMSVNWMFDAGSNWMRGRERWKANTLWSALFHDMLYSLVDAKQRINEKWKMSVFSFKHIQKKWSTIRIKMCDSYTLLLSTISGKVELRPL